MFKQNRIAVVILALGVFADAGAAEVIGVDEYAVGIGIAGKFGTTGAGGELGYRFNEYFAIRAGHNVGRLSYESEGDTGEKFKFSFHLKNTPVILDWHVFGGKFRLSAGYVHNENNMHSVESGLLDIGSGTYNTTLTTDVTFGNSAAYVGLGWTSVPSTRSGFGFSIDIGVLRQGEPEITLAAPGVPQGDLDQQAAQFSSDFKGLRTYPVVSLGVGYTF